MKVLIGNDAEFILVRDTGQPTSAVGLIGGSKSYPREVECGALQEDNVLAEINIVPADNAQSWEKNTTEVIRHLSELLPINLRISEFASAIYPDYELLSPQALEFGCDPDFNAWTGNMNPRPLLPKKLRNLRSAGGHIHIGVSFTNTPKGLSLNKKWQLVQCLDMVGGLQAVILDKDTRRKKLYGKAGAMRIKPYGIEWRTPSNFWTFDKVSRAWIFTVAQFCARKQSALSKFLSQEVQHIINNNSKAEALLYLGSLNKKIKLPLHPKIRI